MAPILTPQQTQALKLIATTGLAKQFYFSGGTALAHYYLQHRLSEDLDFFNLEEFDPQAIVVALKSLQPQLKFLSFDFQSSFNRNLFFLKFDWDVDPLQLASRLHEIGQHLDDPILLKNAGKNEITQFFQQEVINFKKQIME